MPRVVLVKLESGPRPPTPSPPFALLFLATALERAGYEVRLHHRWIETKAETARLTDELLADHPLFVGFSTLSGPGLIHALEASLGLRAVSRVPIVWGGLHPTLLLDQVLAEPCVDVAVHGEGEETVVELADSFHRAGSGRPNLGGIAGIAFTDSGRIVVNPPRPFIRNLDPYPPAWPCLETAPYFSKAGLAPPGGRIASILTSRGCPGRCAFCSNTTVNRGTFRALSVRAVLDQVRELRKSHGICGLNILDDQFFGDLARAGEIARNLGLPWKSSARVYDIVRWGDDVLAELGASGCSEFRIGAESGSQRLLERLRMDITREDIVRAAERCGRHGIRARFSFMIGLPGETEADRRMTYDLMDRLEDMGGLIAVDGPFVYFPWPGTSLYREALRLGYKPPSRTRDWGWGNRPPRPAFTPRRLRSVEHYSRMRRQNREDSPHVPVFLKGLGVLARVRWRRRAFRLPLDYYLPRAAVALLRRFKFRITAGLDEH
ncbi:MAG: radical SAM protein [Candidatus Aminicenantes bacterium]|nr:radical SAM protein [Candidatus Aminicenantes bacterium]